MERILILILGKGQPPKLFNTNEFSYRKANYYFADNEERINETPFVGEAIIRLQKEKTYDKVFILGTIDSMWSTLYAHCISSNNKIDDDNLKIWEDLQDISKEPNYNRRNELLSFASNEFTSFIGVKTECIFIEVGKNNSEFWNIFESISNIPSDNQSISIDITHGLRFQPFFLVLALNFVSSIKENINIDNIYYGALELTDSYFDGKTPIFDLKPILEIMDWVNAAKSFQKYGDITQLIQLFKQQDVPSQTIQAATLFSNTLKLNILDSKQIKNAANQFNSKIISLVNQKNPNLKPLELLQDLVKDYPNKILRSKKNWETTLFLAERNLLSDNQLGFSIIATWEALILRLAEIYNNVDSSDNNIYSNLSRIARNRKTSNLDPSLKGFHENASKLNEMRNTVAHIRRTTAIDINQIPIEYPKIFEFFKINLYNTSLEKLPSTIKLNTN